MKLVVHVICSLIKNVSTITSLYFPPGPPVDYSTIQTDARHPPPRLGEHTQQVLAELLGYDSTQVQQLEANGAISSMKSQKTQS